MEIPYQDLSQETLRTLIETFVMREGTDYGHQDFDLDTKVDEIIAQLKKKTIVIVFDVETESFNLKPKK